MSFREQEQRRRQAEQPDWIMFGAAVALAGIFFVLLAKWAG